MKTLQRVLKLALLGVLTILVFTGCSSTKLAESFDAATVEEQAKEITDLLIAGEYDKIYDQMNEEMKALLTSETLKTNMDTMNELTGSFQEYKSTAVIGQKDANTKQDMAVAVIVAVFEKRNVTYTISFDTNMQLAGFYMK